MHRAYGVRARRRPLRVLRRLGRNRRIGVRHRRRAGRPLSSTGVQDSSIQCGWYVVHLQVVPGPCHPHRLVDPSGGPARIPPDRPPSCFAGPIHLRRAARTPGGAIAAVEEQFAAPARRGHRRLDHPCDAGRGRTARACRTGRCPAHGQAGRPRNPHHRTDRSGRGSGASPGGTGSGNWSARSGVAAKPIDPGINGRSA